MKQRIIALLTTGLLVLSLAGCAAQNTAQTLPESVTAGGSGKATAEVDVAQLTLGVETEGLTTEEAREKNAETVRAAVDFLTGMGVAEADIKTERVYLGEQYDGVYQMSTRMTVLVREVAFVFYNYTSERNLSTGLCSSVHFVIHISVIGIFRIIIQIIVPVILCAVCDNNLAFPHHTMYFCFY